MYKLIMLMVFCCAKGQESSATEKVKDFCDSDQFGLVSKSAAEIDDLRVARDNQFTDNWKDILNYLKNPGGNGDELFDVFIVPAIFLFIFIFLLLVTLVFFICLCCQKCESNKRNKACIFFAWLFFILFVGLFVLMLVYIGLSQSKVNDTLCSIFKLPSGVIDGYQDDNSQYIGLSKLKSSLKSFQTEMDQLPNVSNNIVNIRNQDVSTKSNQAWAQLGVYAKNNQILKVVDGEGNQKTPNSILQQTPGINVFIEEEFSKLDFACEKISKGANDSSILLGDVFRSQVKSTISQIVTKIEEVILKVDEIVDPGSDHVEDTLDFAKNSYWVLFGFCIVLFILVLIVLVIATCICRGSCVKQLKLARILLIVIGIFMIVYAIFVFVLMMGSAAISGFCGFVGRINKNQVSILYEFQNDLEKEIIQISEICLFTNSTGNINEMIIDNTNNVAFTLQNSYMETIDNVLDGYSAYRLLRQNQTTSNVSDSINKYGDTLQQYGDGKVADFDNVVTKLKELNDLIDCNDESFQLAVSVCGGTTGCKGILETATYVGPACSSDKTKAESDFTLLKNYLNSEIAYITLNKTNLLDPTGNSVQAKFKIAKQSFFDIDGDSKAVEDKLKESLAITQTFKSSWKQINDCRNLRKIFIDFEIETCLEFNYYVYILLVLSSVALIVLFIINWFLWFLLRYVGEEEQQDQTPPQPRETIVDIEFKDREKIPFY